MIATIDAPIISALTLSINIENAKHNLTRARWALLIYEKHEKQVAKLEAISQRYYNDWRTAQAFSKQELDRKITNHQKLAIDFWLRYSYYKNL